jgi:hypothetical protein
VVNVTVEALAHLLLDELIGLSQDEAIVEVELGVSSGAGQTGSAIWRA